MPEFDRYSDGYRTLMAEFKCQRCNTTAIAPLKDCRPNNEGERYLRNLNPPNGWSDHFYGRLLCPECTQKLRDFMNMEDDT